MLHPHAHGEGFLAHGHAMAVQHLEGVPGAVARRQHQCLAGDLLATGQHGCADTALYIETHILQPSLETILGAPSLGFLPDEHRAAADDIRAHVGLAR